MKSFAVWFVRPNIFSTVWYLTFSASMHINTSILIPTFSMTRSKKMNSLQIKHIWVNLTLVWCPVSLKKSMSWSCSGQSCFLAILQYTFSPSPTSAVAHVSLRSAISLVKALTVSCRDDCFCLSAAETSVYPIEGEMLNTATIL